MNKKLWIAVAALVWLISLAGSGDRCDRAWLAWGIEIDSCPDGALRQTARLSTSGLRRGAPGEVQLQAFAHYTTAEADSEQRAAVPRAHAITLALVGKATTKALDGVRWDDVGTGATAKLTLPEVPDGDYQLRARFETALGAGEVTLPLALYAPARIHVLTDRPLYEPGNTVRFRAVVLRANDLAPLDHRPGTWVVTSPDNEVLLEEAAPAGDWGVVAGSFPLDKAARTGTWKVAWRSAGAIAGRGGAIDGRGGVIDGRGTPTGSAAEGRGGVIDEVPFTVEPFTLPRFRVDAVAGKPFYRAGDRPVIKGAVIYASGAPVAAAQLDVTWDVAGDWPPPLDWLSIRNGSGRLPKRVATAANGRFELALPEVPADLQGRATLTARISAVDPAGDRVAGAASVLLSKDGIQVSAVTELSEGLVESFNNRLYVRVTTPDGRVVGNTKVTLQRAWQPGDRGVTAELDEDGVASVQIDPGAPVNIVIPAAPWRPAPPRALVTRGEAQELIGGQGASLADQVVFDRWLALLAPCAKWVTGDTVSVKLGLRVAAAGQVLAAGAGSSAVERCVVAIARQQHLPVGGERLYAIDLGIADPALPTLGATVESALALPAGLDAQFATLARSTRDCLPASDGRLANMLTWRVAAGSKAVELTGWIPDPTAADGRAALGCVTSRVGGAHLALAEPAASDALGLVRFAVALPASDAQARPQPTTMLGYELLVTVAGDDHPSAKLRIAPGNVPPLRLRVSPVLAQPGEQITAEMFRGPAWRGELPKKLVMQCLKAEVQSDVDQDHRATFVLPAGTEGWCAITAADARALVYVRPAAELSVSVVPGRDRYKPGERAELAIHTTLGGKGGPAAVGLFGVDDSLGQLVPLPDGDALGRIRPKVETTAPAFGVLDGQALTLGRIRGANAAAATVLRVASIPATPELDAVVTGQAETTFDPIAELTDRFYVVLAELHAQARAWEAKAPAAEKMAPATMARLWSAALDACKARGQRIDDAYGRRLRLVRLPADLLALTDPRAVVVVATRLPEDVENWPAWVAKEQP